MGIKLNIQKTKIMASGPIVSRQIDEETVETVADFIFLSSKITADGYCSHEIKRRFMYGCESWTVKKTERRRIDAFELCCWRRLGSPLDCKEIQPVHSEGDQLWDFFGRNDAKAETPVLWPPDAKS